MNWLSLRVDKILLVTQLYSILLHCYRVSLVWVGCKYEHTAFTVKTEMSESLIPGLKAVVSTLDCTALHWYGSSWSIERTGLR